MEQASFLTQKNHTVATIGFFDGVHRGHRFLLNRVCDEAKRLKINSIAITFDQHPRMVLQQDFQPKLLTLFPEKMQLLQNSGINCCKILPFTRDLAQMSAGEFLEKVLYNIYNVKKLIIGHDHRFGHKREESFKDYQKYAARLGIEVEQTPAFVENGVTVSSSVIRRLLNEGNVKEANHYLGYNYALSGEVVHGNKIGSKIGFPTANIVVDNLKLIPKNGIYAVKIEVKGKFFDGMLNIGFRPTLNSTRTLSIEANIFDFSENIYGENIKIIFIKRIRDERKFNNLDELAQQLSIDKCFAIK